MSDRATFLDAGLIGKIPKGQFKEAITAWFIADYDTLRERLEGMGVDSEQYRMFITAVLGGTSRTEHANDMVRLDSNVVVPKPVVDSLLVMFSVGFQLGSIVQAGEADVPRKFPPLKAEHPLVNPLHTWRKPCPGCDQYFKEGDVTTLVTIGPGDDEDAQRKAREGGAYNAVAVVAHWTCVTGEPNEDNSEEVTDYESP